MARGSIADTRTRGDPRRRPARGTGRGTARATVIGPGRSRRPDRPAAPGGGDRGSDTVEAALGLGTLALVTALAIAALGAATASVRCADAARELVRLAARGEPERGRTVATRLAPPDAQIVLTVRGDEATAEVTATPVRLLPVRVSGRAVAVLEPDAQPDAPPDARWGAEPDGPVDDGVPTPGPAP